MAPPVPYTPFDKFPDLSAQLLIEPSDPLRHFQTWGTSFDIDSIENTTPIKVHTDLGNIFETGDRITIIGSAVAAAQGDWPIVKINATTFSLTGSTAGGTGGAAGKAFHTYLGTLNRLIDACYQLAPTAAVALADGAQTIIPTRPYQTYFLAVPAAAENISLATISWPIPQLGTVVRIVRPAAGAHVITIDREVNTGGNIVTLPSATWASAECVFTTGGLWKLVSTTGGTPGADA
jgi:hypothetical protein